MMKLLVILLLFLAYGLNGADEIVFHENLDNGCPGDFAVSKKGESTVFNADGKKALRLANGGTLLTKKIPVEGNCAYRLSFYGMVDGPGNFEDSPQLEYLFMHGEKKKLGRDMAGWKIIFYDSEGKNIVSGFPNPGFWRHVFSKGMEFYQDEFYIPAKAAHIAFEFRSGCPDDALVISRLKLEKMDISKTLNVNPAFKLGEHNYSGYNYMSKGQMTKGDDGICRLDLSKGWVIGDPISVKPGDNLKISLSAKGVREMGSVLTFNYYDGADKKLSEKHGQLRIPSGKQKELSYEFIVPENAATLRIILGGGIYDWVKLERNSK